ASIAPPLPWLLSSRSSATPCWRDNARSASAQGRCEPSSTSRQGSPATRTPSTTLPIACSWSYTGMTTSRAWSDGWVRFSIGIGEQYFATGMNAVIGGEPERQRMPSIIPLQVQAQQVTRPGHMLELERVQAQEPRWQREDL